MLVGINGAGKSNVADALRFVGDAVRDGLEHAVASRQGFGSLRRWSRGRPFDLTLVLHVRLGDVDWSWGICLTADRANEFRVKWEAARAEDASSGWDLWRFIDWSSDEPEVDDAGWKKHKSEQRARLGAYSVGGGAWKDMPFPDLKLSPPPRSLVLTEIAKLDPRFQPLVDHLSGLMVYSLFPPTLRQPQSSDPTRPMRRQGENWATHLRNLDKDTQGAELLAGLGRVVGDIDDYKVTAVGGFPHPRVFAMARTATANAGSAPRRSRQRHPPHGRHPHGPLADPELPRSSAFEEPELAVHPGALPLLVDFMKQAAAETQVIVTSHSPELLDLVDNVGENLRVVERGDEGTTVARLTAARAASMRYATSCQLHERPAPGGGAPGRGP